MRALVPAIVLSAAVGAAASALLRSEEAGAAGDDGAGRGARPSRAPVAVELLPDRGSSLPTPSDADPVPPPPPVEAALAHADPVDPDDAPPRARGLPAPPRAVGGAPRHTRESFLAAYGAVFLEHGLVPDPAAAETAWATWKRHPHSETGTAHSDLGMAFVEVREREIAARDDVVRVLALPGNVPARDPEALERLFARRVAGPTLALPLDPAAGPVPDGATIVVPAGVHALSFADVVRSPFRFPKDLAIEGRGMDETLVRFPRYFRTEDAVWNLHLADCTVDLDGGSLLGSGTRVGGETAVALRAQRVRFVGWGDRGLVHPPAGPQRRFAYVTDCVFAGGYAAPPGRGRELGPGRFERCRFEGLEDRPQTWRGLFVDCEFRHCQVPKPGLVGDSFERCRAEGTFRPTRRRLSDLFPDAR